MFALHLIISLSVSLAAPPSILPPKELATARTLVSEISEFIMTLDLGSGTVKGYNKTWPGTLNASIFINGNLARVLLGSHRLTGNATRGSTDSRGSHCSSSSTLASPTLTSRVFLSERVTRPRRAASVYNVQEVHGRYGRPAGGAGPWPSDICVRVGRVLGLSVSEWQGRKC